jgi:hypothetical protein
MLNVLATVLNCLPHLMSDQTKWQHLNINYEIPRTERIWMQYGDIRINLHRIFPSTKKPFFHPHPWPCSMIILDGTYEMGLGYGSKTPQVISTCVLSKGARYEMTSKYAWHYVKPLNGEPVYSIMVSGLPWKNIALSESGSASHTSLNSHIFNELFQIFITLLSSKTPS